MDYTYKLLSEYSKKNYSEDLDYTPISIPIGYQLPETTQQTMARMMLSNNMISLDDYHKMLGVVFDGEFTSENETFADFEGVGDDEFRQSQFAVYEESFTSDGVSDRSDDVKKNDRTISDGGEKDVKGVSETASEEKEQVPIRKTENKDDK